MDQFFGGRSESLQKLPVKYINNIDNKIDKYSRRIISKTEKTLTKLAKWEGKIKAILEKTSPETAQRLFGNGKTTFSTVLEQYKKGQKIIADTREKYNQYQDDLNTGFKFLKEQKDNVNAKLVKPITETNKKLEELDDAEQQQRAVEVFIKQRKKELIDKALQFAGNSKYLSKINSESVYYIETIKNYKSILSDKKKAEETALTLLYKIPAFNKFMEENSFLSSLITKPAAQSTAQSLSGLQTRESVNTIIQNQIARGGPNAQAQVQQNLQQAQAALNKIKDKLLQSGGAGANSDMPMKTYNPEKAKTFRQRLEIKTDVQFSKSTTYLPTSSQIGLTVGYKFTPKLIAGIGISYKLGMGKIEKIKFTSESIGARGYVDYKLKYNFYASGGFEYNYNTSFKNIKQLKNADAWQKSLLIGIGKKLPFKTKLTKGKTIQLLYDAYARQHIPVTQSWVFRIGYKL